MSTSKTIKRFIKRFDNLRPGLKAHTLFYRSFLEACKQDEGVYEDVTIHINNSGAAWELCNIGAEIYSFQGTDHNGKRYDLCAESVLRLFFDNLNKDARDQAIESDWCNAFEYLDDDHFLFSDAKMEKIIRSSKITDEL